MRRLAATAAETGPSTFLVEAIHEREQQLRDITDQLWAQGDDSVESHLADIRNFITERMANLRALLAGDPGPVRKELLNHVSEIRMVPQTGNGKSHYVAEGSWHLLGNERDGSEAIPTQIRVVAGAGFEPATFGL